MFERYRAQLVERHGEEKTARVLAVDRFNNLVWPNVSVNARFAALRVVQAAGGGPHRGRGAVLPARRRAQPQMHELTLQFVNLAASPGLARRLRRPGALRALPARLESAANDWIDVRRGVLADRRQADGSTLGGGTSELAIRNQFEAWLEAHAMKAELETFVLPRRGCSTSGVSPSGSRCSPPTACTGCRRSPGRARRRKRCRSFTSRARCSRMRVERLERADVHVQTPPSRTVHHVSAIETFRATSRCARRWSSPSGARGRRAGSRGACCTACGAKRRGPAHRSQARGSHRQRGAAPCARGAPLMELPAAKRPAPNQTGVGVPRPHARRLVAGRGRYTDDIALARPLHAAFLRSPHAHARIVRLDLAPARAVKGVIAAYDGAALAAVCKPWQTKPGDLAGASFSAAAAAQRSGAPCGRGSRWRSYWPQAGRSPKTRSSASRSSGSRSMRSRIPEAALGRGFAAGPS